MIVKLCQMTNKHFSPLMIVLVLVGVLANFVQFRQNESLKADLQARTTQNQLIQADNRNLANQLENSQIQLEAYQKQVDDLNQKVLAKMKQAEQRSNEILNELEKHKKWADSAVPPSVGKLLNQRKRAVSHPQIEPIICPKRLECQTPATEINTNGDLVKALDKRLNTIEVCQVIIESFEHCIEQYNKINQGE